MALTSAEKMKAYRQRLKDGGGKTFAIDIEGERLRWITSIAQSTNVKQTEAELLRQYLTNAIDRHIDYFVLVTKLIKSGVTEEQLIRFHEDNREKPFTNIADYL